MKNCLDTTSTLLSLLLWINLLQTFVGECRHIAARGQLVVPLPHAPLKKIENKKKSMSADVQDAKQTVTANNAVCSFETLLVSARRRRTLGPGRPRAAEMLN